jgi:hypothetical protein
MDWNRNLSIYVRRKVMLGFKLVTLDMLKYEFLLFVKHEPAFPFVAGL